MRRILLILLSSVIYFSFQAQDSLKFQKFYPHKGDWAVTLSVSPFINLMGNIMRVGSDDNFYNPLKLSFSPILLHMITDNKARIYSLDYYGTHETRLYDTRAYTSDPLVTNSYDKDKLTIDFYLIKVGIGTQWRKNKGHFQLYYGYQLNLRYVFGPKAKFTPGYDFSIIDTVETVNYRSYNVEPVDNYNFFKVINVFNHLARSGYRNLSVSYGGGIGLGVTGIFGVDFFILPKIALGGNVSFYGGGNYFFPGKRTYEYFDFNDPNTIIYGIRTDEIPGYFNLHFHYNLVSGLYLRIFL